MDDKDFELVNLPEEARDPEIKAEDFTLQAADNSVHEQKFQTKPTTFFKDSLKRFKKNKSSVVAAYILGILVLLAIFVPIFDSNPVTGSLAPEYKNLEPKLFDGGGFWDGTKEVKDAPVDTTVDPWLPDPESYVLDGIQQDTMKYTGDIFTNTASKYGHDGYFMIGYYAAYGAQEAVISSYSPNDLGYVRFTLDITRDHIKIASFETADEERVKDYSGGQYSVPTNFVYGDVVLEMVFHEEGKQENTIVPLTEKQIVHSVGMSGGTEPIDINEKIAAVTTQTEFDNFYFQYRVTPHKEEDKGKNVCALVKKLVFMTDSTDKKQQAYFGIQSKLDVDESTTLDITGISFDNAMELCSRNTLSQTEMIKYRNIGYWKLESDQYFREIYLGKCVFASFRYDTYYAVFGPKLAIIDYKTIEDWTGLGYIEHGIEPIVDEYDNITYDPDVWQDFCDEHNGRGIIVKNEKCPIVQEELDGFNIDDAFIPGSISGIGTASWSLRIKVYNYKMLGHTSMPKYLFGTDKKGYDMFKYVFEGLRNSLLLGVFTFAVCFLFGLLWGAICGYFGGTVDLVMERITDILAGLPWIVLMTLIILKAGQTFWTFALALCLTGWIGTAATTRTQFYRFRGREYVLASRTLGASDARLIAKHILPNALGTIITGAVLMIPSVIFSEATISYLGLGFQGLSSLGVILSDNQAELFNHPYQLIFPSVVIALVMISFNLFGNGLRDAINPSLKGEDE